MRFSTTAILLVSSMSSVMTTTTCNAFVPSFVSSPSSLSSSSTSSSSSSTTTTSSSGTFGGNGIFGVSSRSTSTSQTATQLHAAEPLLFVDETNQQVSEYYGKTLVTSADLLTNACCTAGSPPTYIQEAIENIAPEVRAKYYGCGLCLPQYNMKGLRVLDLGCGAGRDVYIASQLVGETGAVVGIDMTPEQLEVAKNHLDYHAEKFGYANVEFHQGFLEKLTDIPELQPASFDVIISNCVINLCQDKEAVLSHCKTLLKPGGELYFSDVYASRRVPKSLRDDQVMWGECLSGALYWNDFENLARKVGFPDPRLVEDAPITINSQDVQRSIDMAGSQGLEFYSATYRLWNMMPDDLEPHCEDYGQAVIYKGTIDRYPSGWLLDKHHYFEKGRVKDVCGNTFNMLHKSLLKEHFEFVGNFDTHYGIFEGCGTSMPFDPMETSSGKGGTAKGGCC